MRYSTFGYQQKAINQLVSKVKQRQDLFNDPHAPEHSAIVLAAPTGAGKTVIAVGMLEHLLDSSDIIDPSDQTTILWVTDDPSLNEQTKLKIVLASDRSLRTNTIISGSYDEEILAPRTIHFLNIQAATKSTRLSKRSDGQENTIWDTIGNTVKARGSDFIVVIDEAHRGVQSTRETSTIVSKIIDGTDENGHQRVPVIIGISATANRFKEAMRLNFSKHSSERSVTEVNIPVSEVQLTGIIKDRVVMYSPHATSGNTTHDTTLLRDAVRRVKEFSDNWEEYAEDQNDGDVVKPVLVVQVTDKPSDEYLNELAQIIIKDWDGITAENFVHVFSEDASLKLNVGEVEHMEPHKIQGDDSVRVVFAKNAINTGWDCPRAEVLMSFRSHSDLTLIAQLIGRIVRQPLARRIQSIEMLNQVYCVLPNFSTEQVDAVAAQFNEDNMPIEFVVGGEQYQRDNSLLDVNTLSEYEHVDRAMMVDVLGDATVKEMESSQGKENPSIAPAKTATDTLAPTESTVEPYVETRSKDSSEDTTSIDRDPVEDEETVPAEDFVASQSGKQESANPSEMSDAEDETEEEGVAHETPFSPEERSSEYVLVSPENTTYEQDEEPSERVPEIATVVKEQVRENSTQSPATPAKVVPIPGLIGCDFGDHTPSPTSTILTEEEMYDRTDERDLKNYIPKSKTNVISVLESLPTFTIPNSSARKSHVARLHTLTSNLSSDGIGDKTLAAEMNDRLYAELDAISRRQSEDLELRISEISHVSIGSKVFTTHGDVVESDDTVSSSGVRSAKLDRKNIHDIYKDVQRLYLKDGLANGYWRILCATAEDAEDIIDAKVRVAALGSMDGVKDVVEDRAEQLVNELLRRYRLDISELNESDQAPYRELRGESREPLESNVRIPQSINSDTPKDSKGKGAFEIKKEIMSDKSKRYAKHIFNDKSDKKFYANLGTWEDEIIRSVIAKEDTFAWYRNARGGDKSLCIPYEKTKNGVGSFAGLYPDFIVLKKDTTTGDLRPVIIDPHGDHLADSFAKLRGYLDYADKYSGSYRAIYPIIKDKASGKNLTLTLHVSETRSLVRAALDSMGTKGVVADIYREHGTEWRP